MTQPNWQRLEREREVAAESLYASQVNPEDCDGCKWWSEMCAQSIGCGPMEALCLNPDSPRYNRMVYDGCRDRKYNGPEKTLRGTTNGV